MKYLLFLLFLVNALAASAQGETFPGPDRSGDTMHLSLQAWQYGYIAALTPTASMYPETQAYLRRVAKRWNGTDTFQVVKVTTTYGQFVKTYQTQLAQSDGMAADFNNELLQMVMGDVMRHPWVLAMVMELRKEYEQRRRDAKNRGIKILEDIKKTTLLDD